MSFLFLSGACGSNASVASSHKVGRIIAVEEKCHADLDFGAYGYGLGGVRRSYGDDRHNQRQGDLSNEKAGQWSYNIVATGSDTQIFLFQRPDGLQVAARLKGGASEIIDAGMARATFSERRAALAAAQPGSATKETVAIKVPGVSIKVDENGGEGESATVSINAGGRSVQVLSDGKEGGEEAVVTVTGGNEKDVRDFIEEQKALSAEVKAALKTAMGLD
jgi:hypothetical protein